MEKEQCKFINDHFSQYTANVLTADEFDRFEKHLNGCGECGVFIEQLQRLSGLLKSVSFEKSANFDDVEYAKLERKLIKIENNSINDLELTVEELDMAAGGGDGSNAGDGNQELCPSCNKPLTPGHQC